MTDVRRTIAAHDERPDAASQHRALIVVAAGEGRRLGHGVPKALVPLRGESLLARALEGCADSRFDLLVLVLPEEPSARVELSAAGRDHGRSAGRTVVDVVGGSTRAESVRRGLDAVTAHAGTEGWDAGSTAVLVHDAARPGVPTSVYDRVLGTLEEGASAVVPALPVTDTIKRIGPADAAAPGAEAPEPVEATVPRSDLRAVQTPQGFTLPVLSRICAHLEHMAPHEAESFTDEAMVAEHLGIPTVCVLGDPLAAKITGPSDLITLGALMDPNPQPDVDTQSSAAAAPALPLVGIGHDVHAFAPADDPRPLRLAGLHWPDEQGLSGHSDGDAVAHAACDALFGAAGLGDLGVHFGTDRPELADASGPTLLAEAARIVREAGFVIGSITVQMVANRPKFGPRRGEAQAVLTEAAGAPVSLSATTSDGLGFTGRGEGVLATAVAVVVRRLG
ncbi:2-C-methyl-D-erythritol 2,4-cyclodiphosphate synthase [Nesterenkonia marinintestina]|uniref:2-C-methyl-D-erythritol 2,4-cyclodiphosphate synthase n=1 Tax=Nesterenkonia marinintestina TaxID=2979865 RepID=UPI0021C10496|nr:2-C-methyl-D-erythritol 2,4-cyclodiphosphate synthase [Nesterenkonia sp. GX14115]